MYSLTILIVVVFVGQCSSEQQQFSHAECGSVKVCNTSCN